jgi:hypothetical protein
MFVKSKEQRQVSILEEFDGTSQVRKSVMEPESALQKLACEYAKCGKWPGAEVPLL